MLSSTQLFELFVVLFTANNFRLAFYNVRSALAHAQAKSGPVRRDTVPTRLCNALFCAVQLIICFLVPVVYMITVVGCGLQPPPWMSALALPEVVFWKYQLRVLACIACILGNRISDSAFEHLGDQYHPIGRREKPRVIQTGPYAWVRHPLYSLALLQGALQCLVFWSYAPLFALVATVVLFAIKIQIEEEVIQRDDAIKQEYRAYMLKVPTKFVPYVW